MATKTIKAKVGRQSIFESLVDDTLGPLAGVPEGTELTITYEEPDQPFTRPRAGQEWEHEDGQRFRLVQISTDCLIYVDTEEWKRVFGFTGDMLDTDNEVDIAWLNKNCKLIKDVQ